MTAKRARRQEKRRAERDAAKTDRIYNDQETSMRGYRKKTNTYLVRSKSPYGRKFLQYRIQRREG